MATTSYDGIQLALFPTDAFSITGQTNTIALDLQILSPPLQSNPQGICCILALSIHHTDLIRKSAGTVVARI